MTERYIITDDNGMPIGSADIGQVQAEATVLAYRMAAYCDDPTELDRVATDAVATLGPDGFGYVAAAALRILAEHILEPTLQVTDALGVDLRPGLESGLRNAETTAGGDGA